MKVQLNGYFDKNFGDDIMHATVLRNFPQHTFYVYTEHREMTAHLEEFENFRFGTAPETAPELHVIGTAFQYNGRISQLYKLWEMLSLRRGIKRRKILINGSVEPVKGLISAALTRCELKKYELIVVRDNKSAKYITDCKLKGVKLLCGSDMVFSCAERIKAMKGKGAYLGIAPVRRVAARANYDYYRKLAAAADAYAESTGERVRLFAFDNGIENDVSACGSIRRMMKHSDMSEIVIYNSDVEEFVRKIGECRKFVTSRFHGAVAAACFDMPIYAVYDRAKLKVLCEDKRMRIPHEERGEVSDGLTEFVTGTPEARELPLDLRRASEVHIKAIDSWLE